MPQENGNARQQVKLTILEKTFRYICHAAGACYFLLPFAMAQGGPLAFGVIAILEALCVGFSLLLLLDIARTKQDKTYYIDIVQNDKEFFLSKVFVFLAFTADVVICNAIYLKTASSLFQHLYTMSPWKFPSTDQNLNVLWIVITSLVIVGSEIWDKYRENTRQCDGQIEADPLLDRAFVPGQDVANRFHDGMRNFTLRRLVVLVMFMSIVFVSISYLVESGSINGVSYAETFHESCLGNWRSPTNLPVAASIILFALMNYTLIIPVLEVEAKPEGGQNGQFRRLIVLSNSILLFVYFTSTFIVHYTFPGQSRLLSVELYGGVHGAVMGICGVVLTITACRLRILACCKMIALMFNDYTYGAYYLTAVIVTFASMISTVLVPSVLHLAMVSGAVTANVLLVIIPCWSYLNLEVNQQSMTKKWMARTVCVVQGILLMMIFAILYFNVPICH